MRKINVADITLKKLSEDRAVSLLFREKSAIANCAGRLGVDTVELPAVLENVPPCGQFVGPVSFRR